MNTNGNTYTVIYSTVLVVLVAAILSFVAMSLQGKQNENVKMETISKVLTAAAESFQTILERMLLWHTKMVPSLLSNMQLTTSSEDGES